MKTKQEIENELREIRTKQFMENDFYKKYKMEFKINKLKQKLVLANI